MTTNSTSGIIGTLTLSAAMLESVVGMGLSMIDTVHESQKIFMIGLIEGLTTHSAMNDLSFTAEELEHATQLFRDVIEEHHPNVVDSVVNDLKTSYDKQYQMLTTMTSNTDLENTVLNYSKSFLGTDKSSLDLLVDKKSLINAQHLKGLLGTSEKIYNKNASLENEEMYKKIIDSSIKVKAINNALKGNIVSGIYSKSYNLGQTMTTIVNLQDHEDFVSVLKNSYLLYNYLSNTTSKTIQLPWKLMEMSSSILMTFNIGIMDSLVNKSEITFSEKELETSHRSAFQFAKDVSKSIWNDLESSYKFQRTKLEKLDSKITDNDSVIRLLEEKPWKKPSDIISRKLLKEDSNLMSYVKPAVDIMNAATKAVTGTVLANSFKAGKWIGQNYFNKNNSPEHSPKLEGNSKNNSISI